MKKILFMLSILATVAISSCSVDNIEDEIHSPLPSPSPVTDIIATIKFDASHFDNSARVLDVIERSVKTAQDYRGLGESDEMILSQKPRIDITQNVKLIGYSEVNQGGNIVSESEFLITETEDGGYKATMILKSSVKSVKLLANPDNESRTANVNTRQKGLVNGYVQLTGTGTVGEIVGGKATISIKLESEMARIEIHNYNPRGVVGGEQLISTTSDIQIHAIYIDNVKLQRGDETPSKTDLDPTLSDPNSIAEWEKTYTTRSASPLGDKYNLWAKGINSKWNAVGFDLWNTTTIPYQRPTFIQPYPFTEGKSIIFNFFPQKATSDAPSDVKKGTPHIVIRFAFRRVGHTNNTFTGVNQFINITKLKIGSNYITEFKAGEVYRINILDIIKLIENESNHTQRPNPDIVDTEIVITVGEWDTEDIKPGV